MQKVRRQAMTDWRTQDMRVIKCIVFVTNDTALLLVVMATVVVVLDLLNCKYCVAVDKSWGQLCRW